MLDFLYEEALVVVLLVAFTILTVHAAEVFHFHIIPESGLVIIIGVIFGGVGYWLDFMAIEGVSKFNLEIFNLVLLPIIIFESGYSLKKRGIFRNFKTIMGYACIGSVISAVFTAACLLSSLTTVSSPQEALLFGSLIAATDPVATLAVFKDVFKLGDREYLEAPLLYDLVFGESVLNDAVAIVLFESFLDIDVTKLDGMTILGLVGKFLAVSVGSTVIGIAYGLLVSLLFKHSSVRGNSMFDVILIVLGAYASYFTSSMVHFSGLFSIFFYGITCGHYTWYNLSAWAQLTSENTFKSYAAVSEMLIFLSLGTSTFGSTTIRKSFDIIFTLKVFGIISVARAMHIFPLSFLANRGRKKKILITEQIALWYSGLRGAIAFTLSLQLAELGTENAHRMIGATLAIAMFTTIVQGASSKAVLKLLGLVPGSDSQTQPSKLVLVDAGAVERDSAAAALIPMATKRSKFSNWDHSTLKKFFCIYSRETGGTSKERFRTLQRLLTRWVIAEHAKKLDEAKAPVSVDAAQPHELKQADVIIPEIIRVLRSKAAIEDSEDFEQNDNSASNQGVRFGGSTSGASYVPPSMSSYYVASEKPFVSRDDIYAMRRNLQSEVASHIQPTPSVNDSRFLS